VTARFKAEVRRGVARAGSRIVVGVASAVSAPGRFTSKPRAIRPIARQVNSRPSGAKAGCGCGLGAPSWADHDIDDA
jgi:hypothetical protein